MKTEDKPIDLKPISLNEAYKKLSDKPTRAEEIDRISKEYFATNPDCYSPRKGFIAGYKLAMEQYASEQCRKQLRDILTDFQQWHNSNCAVDIDDITVDEYLNQKGLPL